MFRHINRVNKGCELTYCTVTLPSSVSALGDELIAEKPLTLPMLSSVGYQSLTPFGVFNHHLIHLGALDNLNVFLIIVIIAPSEKRF